MKKRTLTITVTGPDSGPLELSMCSRGTENQMEVLGMLNMATTSITEGKNKPLVKFSKN